MYILSVKFMKCFQIYVVFQMEKKLFFPVFPNRHKTLVLGCRFYYVSELFNSEQVRMKK